MGARSRGRNQQKRGAVRTSRECSYPATSGAIRHPRYVGGRGSSGGLQISLHERCRRLRDDGDGVAVGTQLPHSLGNPMSQRESPGFNRAGLPSCEYKPLAVAPEASPFRSRPRHFCLESGAVRMPSTQSLACGVAHPMQSLPDAGSNARWASRATDG
jgi:hypothetical protein